STEYKHFDEPINYFAGDVPDTGIIYIVIENPHGSVHLGSSFVIDDLAIEGVGSDPFIYVQSGSKYQFKLEDNFPNPCTSLSTIRYSIPEVESVTLSIFDMLGTPVAILENGIEPAGPHEVSFYSEHLPSGLYLCKLQSSSGEVVSRAIQVVH
ncbi:MAG TPA: T9SS type A sorting domain-containing protein, partial [Candidatus Kapabacteria bacterium]|nr:T9SS type A sorting domain-containing protein [Candidatus Kapabacteria bacterium]